MVELTSISFGIALFGGIYDLFTRRIPNWLTFPSMILGISAQAFYFGWQGVGNSLLGITVGFLLLIPIYFLKFMGAGDVKLLMVIGAWSSALFCLYVVIAAIFLGGVYAICDVIVAQRFTIVLRAGYRFVRSLFVPVLVVEIPALDKERKFSFGIYLAIAVAIVIWLQHSGRL